MKRNKHFLRLSFLSTLILSFLFVSGVFAAAVTIDGDPMDWPGDPTCTVGEPNCSLITEDPDEWDIPNANDVRTFWATNSTDSLFLRYDTEADTDYSAGQRVRICLDIPAEGPGKSVAGCPGLATDRMIFVMVFSADVQAKVFDCNTVNCNSLYISPLSTVQFAHAGKVNEVGVPFADIGIQFPADVGKVIQAITYFDNASTPDDDLVPGTGVLVIPLRDGLEDDTQPPGTGTIGYWKTHPESWPVSTISIGGVLYTKEEAITVMEKPARGDKTYNQYAQLVAAKLNVELGNPSECVLGTVAAADSWMVNYPLGSGVRAKSQAWQQGGPFHEVLDAYNNGELCAPHR